MITLPKFSVATCLTLSLIGCSVVVHNKIKDNKPQIELCSTEAESNICNDGNQCNGLEACNPNAETADERGCVGGNPAADGITCDSDGNADTIDICVKGTCVFKKGCGDGFVDTAAQEICDDGNTVEDDGCKTDCTFTCTGDTDCVALLGTNVCTDNPRCNKDAHRCIAGNLRNGLSCTIESNAAGTCQNGECVP